MKFCLIVSLLLLVLIVDAAYGVGESDSSVGTSSTSTSSSKTTEKISYPKKVTSLKKKPTKSPPALSSGTTKVTMPTKKTTKKAADVTAAFKDLPEDDLDFIKELDKQFKVHGDKIKIKVENDNTTDTKNSKRTIEGDLGYGYQHNGYEYNRPKFMFYPYSQEDIAKGAPGYYPNYDKTSVTIEPSYSYELKPQSYEQVQHDQHQIDLPQPEGHQEEQHQQQQPDQHAYQPEQQQQQEPHYEEPVIVLRIPGPAKYASHLQKLLQQYLEIRASQYLRILEEAEQRKQHETHAHQEQDQHVQQVQHYEEPQVGYEAPAHPATHEEAQHYSQGAQEEQPHYTQEVAYAHQMAPTPQPVSYPDIDDVYQTYKGRHHVQQQLQQQHQAPQPQAAAYYTQAHAYHAAQQQHQEQQHLEQHHQQQQLQLQQHEEAPQYYYMHQQQYEQSRGHAYQHVYLISMASPSTYGADESHEHQQHLPQQPIYVQEEQAAEHAAHEHEHAHEHTHEHAHTLSQPLSENSPRKTHTKVIFTHNSEQGAGDYHGAYSLPSIRPYERHAPTSTPTYQQQPQQQPHYEQPHPQQLEAESAAHQQHVATPTHPQQESTASAHHDHHDQQETVAITQRPFNYHAHALKVRMRGGAHKRDATKDASVAASNIKTTTVAESEHQLQNIRAYVRDKLGAKMGSAVEFKTTQVVKG